MCNSSICVFTNSPVNIPTTPLRIEIDADTKRIQIHHDGNAAGADDANHLTCVLEVPVQSELNITGAEQRNIHVERLYSDAVRLQTCGGGNISTRNLNGFRFEFVTHGGGSVHCAGNTLANQITIQANDTGNVHLAKMQGDLLYVLCDSGCIRTDSCYTEASKFVTHSGHLDLHNVHKFAEMYVLEAGRLDVSGFHGRLMARLSAAATAQLQLTEVYGDSSIEIVGENVPAEAEDGTPAARRGELILNVSDFVLENNEIDVRVEGTSGARVRLAETLADSLESEWWDCVSAEADVFHRVNPNLNASDDDRLQVRSFGDVLLGKMSWTDTLKLKLNVK